MSVLFVGRSLIEDEESEWTVLVGRSPIEDEESLGQEHTS
jgi:hypothetical protein